MTKHFYTSPKPKYGNPRTQIHAYKDGVLVSLTYHRKGLETQMQEANLTAQGYVKQEWANKPTTIINREEEEDDNDE